MATYLELGRPNGVSYNLIELNDSSDYNVLVGRGPKEGIKFVINALTPRYTLIIQKTTDRPELNLYEKAEFVPKQECHALKEVLLTSLTKPRETRTIRVRILKPYKKVTR